MHNHSCYFTKQKQVNEGKVNHIIIPDLNLQRVLKQNVFQLQSSGRNYRILKAKIYITSICL